MSYLFAKSEITHIIYSNVSNLTGMFEYCKKLVII
jgi:hypothetical protein